MTIDSAIAPNSRSDDRGELDFHDWKKGSWTILFSHPADFTPVCTTELGRVAALKQEFESRNTKVIGLSVDPLASHRTGCRTSRTSPVTL